MALQRVYTIEEYKKVLNLHKLGLGSTKIFRITMIPKSTIHSWLFKGYLPKHFSKKYKVTRLKNLLKAKQKIAELKEMKLLELSKAITKDFAYILGAVLGDGYIYLRKYGGEIRISVRDKETHFIKGRKVIVKPVFTLGFDQKKNLEIFYNKIGFSIKRKQFKLEKIVTSYQRNQIMWAKEELEFLKKNSYRNYRWIAKKLNRSPRSVLDALRRYGLKLKVDNRLLS